MILVRVNSVGWGVAMALAFAAFVNFDAQAASPAQTAKTLQGEKASLDARVSNFYQARGNPPFWFAPNAGDAADQLIRLIGTVEADGLSPREFQAGSLLLAIRAAEKGDAAAAQRAEMMLSTAFVNYAQALQRDPRVGVIYVDQELKPRPLTATSLLNAAAEAPSLADHIRELGWMNPLYAQLRRAIVRKSFANAREHELLKVNLERVRALPSLPRRYVIVNIANQRLYMYDDSKVVDEMKVVAGRIDAQTPMMNAYIRHAVLNPYWNVPADISSRLALNVVKRGSAYLSEKGYQVVSGPEDSNVLDPATIDWSAVAAGRLKVHLRQLPGPANAMGRVKFMFPNSQGIWLHDTPSRDLFDGLVRAGSNGCVRLEDAWRLGRWLFNRPLDRAPNETERKVELPVPVPVYITYLTALPRGEQVQYVDDVYQRDFPAFISNMKAPAADLPAAPNMAKSK